MKLNINFLQISLIIIIFAVIYFFNYQEGARGNQCGRLSENDCIKQSECKWGSLLFHYECMDK